MCRNLSAAALIASTTCGCAWPVRAHGDAGDEVEEAVAVDVPDLGAAAVRHHERIVARVRGRDDRSVAREHGPGLRAGEFGLDVRVRHGGLLEWNPAVRREVARARRAPRGCARAGRAGFRVRPASAARSSRRSRRPAVASRSRRGPRRRSTPSNRAVSCSSSLAGCGCSTPKSVITACGPVPRIAFARAHRCRRESRRWCGNRAARRRLRGVAFSITNVCRACAAISGAPPAPGRRVCRRVVRTDHRAVQVAEASTCAAPRKPTSTRPACS